jgi:GNAT superfamily N-acetyltransferase
MPVDYYLSNACAGAIIRDTCPEDGPRLVDGLAALSAESRTARFFHDKRHFSPDELHRLAAPSDRNHLKRVAVVRDEECDEQIIGLARCVRLGATGPVADFGIVVRDEFTHVGVGTRLVFELREAACAAGITHWRADFFAINHGAEKLLHLVGSEEQRESLGDGIVRVTYRLALEATAPISDR